MVASRRLLSGVEASGVRVTVSVMDWPTASETGVKARERQSRRARRRQGDVVLGTLPTLVIVSVSVTPAPGVVLTLVGLPVMVTASIAGTVKVTVWVLVMVGLVVLVAVTVNDSCVPGPGCGWPGLGTR